jgi:three-Cys-motif partner protein
MPTRDSVVWERDPHTAAKHDLLRSYLSAWVPILVTTFGRATYAEGFAGPGVYEGGEPGSPVIALEVVSSHRGVFVGSRQLDLVFVEERADRHARLQSELSQAVQRISALPAGVVLHPSVRGDCADVLLGKLDGIDAWGAPVLVVLDSWGGPDIPHSLVSRVAANKASEVLITFGPAFLTRFGENPDHREQGDAAFGSTAWRVGFEQPSERKHTFLVQAYRDSLHAAGFQYVLAFEMVDEKGHPLWLMFGTSDKKGVEKMKDAMWKVDPSYGVRYRDPRDPAQMTLDISHPDDSALTTMITAQLDAGPRSLDELRDFALTETV